MLILAWQDHTYCGKISVHKRFPIRHAIDPCPIGGNKFTTFQFLIDFVYRKWAYLLIILVDVNLMHILW